MEMYLPCLLFAYTGRQTVITFITVSTLSSIWFFNCITFGRMVLLFLPSHSPRGRCMCRLEDPICLRRCRNGSDLWDVCGLQFGSVENMVRMDFTTVGNPCMLSWCPVSMIRGIRWLLWSQYFRICMQES